jgi:hypothetical protein
MVDEVGCNGILPVESSNLKDAGFDRRWRLPILLDASGHWGSMHMIRRLYPDARSGHLLVPLRTNGWQERTVFVGRKEEDRKLSWFLVLRKMDEYTWRSLGCCLFAAVLTESEAAGFAPLEEHMLDVLLPDSDLELHVTLRDMLRLALISDSEERGNSFDRSSVSSSLYARTKREIVRPARLWRRGHHGGDVQSGYQPRDSDVRIVPFIALLYDERGKWTRTYQKDLDAALVAENIEASTRVELRDLVPRTVGWCLSVVRRWLSAMQRWLSIMRLGLSNRPSRPLTYRDRALIILVALSVLAIPVLVWNISERDSRDSGSPGRSPSTVAAAVRFRTAL